MRTLIVEDDFLLATSLCAALQSNGHEAVGPASSLQQARALSMGDVDAAILDANLKGESTAPLAMELNERGIPFVVYTGYSRDHLDPPLRTAKVVSKPADLNRLVQIVEAKVDCA
ncbi:MAG: response regulator [Hyphomicrobiaceae bacterium]